MVSPHLVQIFMLYFCLYCSIFSLHLPHATSLSFNFNFSQPGGFYSQDFSFQGDAYFDSQMIELTTNDRSKGIDNSVGRVSYAQSVPLWDNVTGELASFTTTFSFQIKTDIITNAVSGDGMAFFLGHYPSSIPLIIDGARLGLFNKSVTTNATGEDQILAVEFDTFLNDDIDTSNNHMGIDVNSIVSQAYTNTTVPGKNLTSGLVMTCRASYDNSTKNFAADLQIGDASYQVVTTVDLKQLLPSVVAIGFSGATGRAVELHRILSWSFDSTLDGPPLPAPAPQGHHASSSSKGKINTGTIVGTVLGLGGSVGIALIVFIRIRQWNKRTAKKRYRKIAGGQVEHFGYRKLELATNKFAEERKLGEGGSASVYRGELTNPNRSVAVKKFKPGASGQGRKAFEDELEITSRPMHRNLVELIGWCYDSQRNLVEFVCWWWDDRFTRLFLVYELVPEGSLDQHLHKGKSWLPWPKRYEIILGLGSALQYLHVECEQNQQCIVHGDIKSSNILLDSTFNAKLGDFGLARFVHHETGSKTTHVIQGTLGYIDPEFLTTGKRNRQSDMYSFGIFLLEMVSGRDPTARDQNRPPLPLQVRGLYRSGEIMEAADGRLLVGESASGRRQMERVLLVGLWCVHQDTGSRPSIAHAMDALRSEDENLDIPPLAPLPILAVASRALSIEEGSNGVHSSTTDR